MSEPFAFTSTTPRFHLPMLFAAQAQKEFFVNEAHSILDTIAHPVVKGMSVGPPSAPNEGEAWIVLSPGEGEWVGQDDAIAAYIGGHWIFVPAVAGMLVFDETSGHRAAFIDGWQTAVEPVTPVGGTTVDSEARSAIEQIVDALRQIGVFSPV